MKKILFLSLILIFTQNNLSFANCLKGDCNNGFGTWEDTDFKYIGQFKDGFFNGQGTVIFNDGESYTGEFSNDAFNGYGTYIFLNGDTYVGDFLDGEFSGYGFHSFSNGETYEGSYLNNQRNGFGNYKFNDGQEYIGEFKNDNYHGFGTLFLNNGDVYEGEFKNGLFDGIGKYTYTSGLIEEGNYKDGIFLSSNSNTDNLNLVEEFFSIELSQSTIRNFIENSGVQYEAFEFIDDSSFSIKNLYFNDGLSEFKIGEITLIDLDYYAINKIKINSDLKINLFDKIIIKEYSYKEDNIDHFIDHFEISNLNINNASLIYDFLNSLDFFNFENIYYILDTISFNEFKINGAKIAETDYYGEWERFEFSDYKDMNFNSILLENYYFNEEELEQKGRLIEIKDLEFNRPQNILYFDINNPDLFFSIFKSLDNFVAKDIWYKDKFDNVTFNADLYEISNLNTIEIDNLFFPVTLDFNLKNVFFSDLDPEIKMYLNMLGYDDLAFDLNFQSSIDYKKEEFTISLDTSIYDAFGLKTKLLFSNLDINSLNLSNEIELMEYFSNKFKFNLFEIEFIDKGMTDKFFLFIEEFYGFKKNDIKQSFLKEINNDPDLQSSIDVKYLKKMLNFIDDPDSIKIIIQPQTPMSFNDILIYSMNPALLIDELNVSLE